MELTSTDRLIATIRQELKAQANPGEAPGMQAYMKSEMPFYGVRSPAVRKLCRLAAARYPIRSEAEFERAIRVLWDEAAAREERYAAIDLCKLPAHAGFQKPRSLRLYEHLITTGAWWDYVDPLASHQVGYLLANYPDTIAPRMRRWSRSKDIWKRRTSILCQLGFKNKTDLDLLYSCIDPSLESKEFFLQKAIGWALREYGKTEPVKVARFVRKNAGRIAPLSRREALRIIERA